MTLRRIQVKESDFHYINFLLYIGPLQKKLRKEVKTLNGTAAERRMVSFEHC